MKEFLTCTVVECASVAKWFVCSVYSIHIQVLLVFYCVLFQQSTHNPCFEQEKNVLHYSFTY